MHVTALWEHSLGLIHSSRGCLDEGTLQGTPYAFIADLSLRKNMRNQVQCNDSPCLGMYSTLNSHKCH
uniref:Uncharacterized protein n=1 Tax=Anguilla anguilla TaxID=7936 RepID=A0A0E9P9Y9_ANGAN